MIKQLPVWVPYDSPEDACKAVGLLPEVKSKFSKLYPLPWNRHQPRKTEWWLSPSSENPAYKYGKYLFTAPAARPGRMLITLNVEKGLGPAVRDAYRSPKGRRYLMEDDWCWHHLLRSFSRVTEAATSIARETGRDVEVELSGGHSLDPDSFDPQAPKPPQNIWRARFTTDGTLSLPDEDRCPDKAFKVMATVKDFASLAHALGALDADPWVWIDFFVGIPVEYATGAPCPAGREEWDAGRLWKSILAPLAEWVR
ncbi:MAG: hypothetical protein PHU25_15295 [Deltaproteobacteria bacterium]|nr:hypothetical protein [Deltaproteobacteria bacterium]